jgi:hypothetical protein
LHNLGNLLLEQGRVETRRDLAREALEVLAPRFLQDPDVHAGLMAIVLTGYLNATAGVGTDRELDDTINKVSRHLVRP